MYWDFSNLLQLSKVHYIIIIIIVMWLFFLSQRNPLTRVSFTTWLEWSLGESRIATLSFILSGNKFITLFHHWMNHFIHGKKLKRSPLYMVTFVCHWMFPFTTCTFSLSLFLSLSLSLSLVHVMNRRCNSIQASKEKLPLCSACNVYFLGQAVSLIEVAFVKLIAWREQWMNTHLVQGLK